MRGTPGRGESLWEEEGEGGMGRELRLSELAGDASCRV